MLAQIMGTNLGLKLTVSEQDGSLSLTLAESASFCGSDCTGDTTNQISHLIILVVASTSASLMPLIADSESDFTAASACCH